MGKLNSSKREVKLQRRMFEEKTKLLGVDGFVFRVKSYNEDYRRDWDNIVHHDPIEISFIFDPAPAYKTFRNYKWKPESDDFSPGIAFLPWTVNGRNLDLKEGALVEIYDEKLEHTKTFIVTGVNSEVHYLINYVVKLVSYRKDEDPLGRPKDPNKEDDTSYEFIDK